MASTLNITRAGEEVHLAQSSVTEQIQSLEADLGTPLFDRSRRRLQLTEAGRRLLEYAGDLLSLADEGAARVKGRSILKMRERPPCSSSARGMRRVTRLLLVEIESAISLSCVAS